MPRLRLVDGREERFSRPARACAPVTTTRRLIGAPDVAERQRPTARSAEAPEDATKPQTEEARDGRGGRKSACSRTGTDALQRAGAGRGRPGCPAPRRASQTPGGRGSASAPSERPAARRSRRWGAFRKLRNSRAFLDAACRMLPAAKSPAPIPFRRFSPKDRSCWTSRNHRLRPGPFSRGAGSSQVQQAIFVDSPRAGSGV